MKKELKNIQTFEQHTDKNLNISDVSDSDNLDLPMEYEYISRKNWKHSKDYDWIMFKLRIKLGDYGVETSFDTRDLKPSLWDASAMKNKSEERFGNMNNETFFELYKKYKSKL